MSDIKCHSSFVHYNMFHSGCNCDCNQFGSIFNVTNHCYGGHTSFWGGLGAGLGMGLGSWLGGICNTFLGGYNMFGGFGNMFNWFGMIGNNFTNTLGTKNDGSTQRTVVANDKDCQIIADFQQEVNDLAKKANITPEEITALKTRITNAKNSSDNYNVDANNKSYDELLRQLDALQTGAPKVADGQGTVGTGNIDPSKVTASTNTDNWTKEDIEKLSANDAKDILNKLGCLDTDGNAKLSTDYNRLLLMKQAQVNVKVAQNTKAGLKDKFIQGKIDNVTKDANGKISYVIDNSSIQNAEFKFKYTFKEDSNTNGKKVFKLTNIDRNGQTAPAYIIQNWQNREYEYDTANQILTINAEPLVTKTQKEGRTSLS